VRLKWKIAQQATCGSVLLTLVGCSGINSTQTVSPLDFLIPGAGHFLELQDPPLQIAPGTNNTFAGVNPLTLLARATQ
jgi:hypothetical protein